MKSATYTSAFLWVLTALLFSGYSSEINKHQSPLVRKELPTASVALKDGYIDNDISLLDFGLNEAITNTEVKTYSL